MQDRSTTIGQCSDWKIGNQPMDGVKCIKMNHSYKHLKLYGKLPKISNTLIYANKMLVIRAGIHTMLVRKANHEDPDQTASEEAV